MNSFWRGSLVGGIGVVVGLPLLVQVIWSFAFRWYFPELLPSEWGLHAWRYVFSDSSRVGEALLTSLGIGLAVSLLSIGIGLPAARALALHDFPGKGLVEWLLLVPIVVPGVVATMGVHLVFIHLRVADTSLGVVLVHLIPAVPYMILVMASVFANYDTALEETARTLGADAVRTFWFVTLPAILPGLLVATLFTFLISWSQYVTTLLIGGGRVITLSMLLFPLIGGSNNATAAAISLVFVAPALLALGFTARSLANGPSVLGGLGRP
ncbi:MAG: ABC transporter permease [Caldilinea sp.]|jgi:putative spermidine/putrescine transport system permease protein